MNSRPFFHHPKHLRQETYQNEGWGKPCYSFSPCSSTTLPRVCAVIPSVHSPFTCIPTGISLNPPYGWGNWVMRQHQIQYPVVQHSLKPDKPEPQEIKTKCVSSFVLNFHLYIQQSDTCWVPTKCQALERYTVHTRSFELLWPVWCSANKLWN